MVINQDGQRHSPHALVSKPLTATSWDWTTGEMMVHSINYLFLFSPSEASGPTLEARRQTGLFHSGHSYVII